MNDDELKHRDRQNMFGILVAVILVVVGYFLIREVVYEARQSDCVAAGHRNCE